MLLSRRTAFAGTGATILAAWASKAQASLLDDNWAYARQVLSKHWRGSGSASFSNLQGGKLTVGMDIDLNIADNKSFSGTFRLTSQWPDATYRAVYGITGNCWGEDSRIGINIVNARMEQADSLPKNLYWQCMIGRLQLYRQSGSEDGWLLDGTLYGTQSNDAFETQLSDHS